MRQQGGEPSLDRAIATLASRAHGVVTRQELLGAGLSSEQIRRRVERGTLIAVHRGAYRVGHRAQSREARYMAGGEGVRRPCRVVRPSRRARLGLDQRRSSPA